MNADFDIGALRSMLSGLEHGSFSRAANELHRSQSAVSMQLKKLEQIAGVKLFDRKGRGLVPTEAGETLISYARQIVQLNDEAARALGAMAHQESVRIGLPQDFYDDVMPLCLNTFSEQYPNVQVFVSAGNNHLLEDAIKTGQIDAAIAFFPKDFCKKGELLCELPLSWLAHGSLAEIPQKEPVPLVLFNHPCLFRKAAIAALEDSQIKYRKMLTTPSLSAVWSALRAQFGVAIRVAHSVPLDISDVSHWSALPELPSVELRLLTKDSASQSVDKMREILKHTTLTLLVK
jgi:DNA-binding transcriptional LysR family regulator